MIVLFGHQNIAKGNFIRLLLLKPSCDRVQSGLMFSLVYTVKIRKTQNDCIKRILKYEKFVNNFIRLLFREPLCDRVEFWVVSITGIQHYKIWRETRISSKA